MSRADAFKYLKKVMPEAIPVAGEPPPPIEFISSGCIAADYITSGGFPRGKLTEVFGPESSGKTTLCLSACAQAQAAGLYPVYIDIERGLDPLFAEKVGFNWQNPELGYYLKPDTFEQVLDIIEVMSTDGKADLIVTDSIPAMVPKQAFEGKLSEMGQLGQVGRLFSGSLPRLTKTIEKTKTAVVFTNQLRANIVTDAWQARFAPKEKTAGGYALKYFASLRLEMRQLKKNAKVTKQPSLTDPTAEEEIPVASRHSILAFKNKVSTPYRQIEFYIRYDADNDIWGIDDLQTLIDIGVGKEIIEAKGGGNFVYNGADAMKVRGEQALYDWFATRPEAIAELREKLELNK